MHRSIPETAMATLAARTTPARAGVARGQTQKLRSFQATPIAARSLSSAPEGCKNSAFFGASRKALALGSSFKSQTRSLKVNTFAASIGDFTADNIDGRKTDLSKYVGKVCLIVNVASAWGLTDQNYKELVTVYNKYKSQGFEVLAFPCNQFGGQEPGSNAEVKKFAAKYGAKFPMFAKIDVNGANAHPLFQYLKKEKGELFGSDIKWNFGKFLVDKTGKPVKRYAPTSSPMSIVGDIEKLL